MSNFLKLPTNETNVSVDKLSFVTVNTQITTTTTTTTSCEYQRQCETALTLHCFKSDRDKIWHDRSSSKYLYASIFDATSYVQDGGHDVISSRVLLSHECICNVCPTHLQQRPSVPNP